jgi:hypothetical protein
MSELIDRFRANRCRQIILCHRAKLSGHRLDSYFTIVKYCSDAGRLENGGISVFAVDKLAATISLA